MPRHRGCGHTDARNRVDQPAHRSEAGTIETSSVAAGRGAGDDTGAAGWVIRQLHRAGLPGVPRGETRPAPDWLGDTLQLLRQHCDRLGPLRRPARGLLAGTDQALAGTLRANTRCWQPWRRAPSSAPGPSQPGHPGKLLSVSHCRHVHTAHGRHVRAAHRRRQLPRPDQGDRGPPGAPPTGGRRRHRHLDRHPGPVRAAGPPVAAGRQHQCGRGHFPARPIAGDLRRRGFRRHLSA